MGVGVGRCFQPGGDLHLADLPMGRERRAGVEGMEVAGGHTCNLGWRITQSREKQVLQEARLGFRSNDWL